MSEPRDNSFGFEKSAKFGMHCLRSETTGKATPQEQSQESFLPDDFLVARPPDKAASSLGRTLGGSLVEGALARTG